MGSTLEQERKIDEYIDFLKKRKEKNSSLPLLKYEKVLIEVEGWQLTALQLLDIQTDSSFYTYTTKNRIQALRKYIETLQPERFINCLTNKYVIDNFQSLNINSQCQNQTRVHYVSMKQTIMTLFSEYLEENKITMSLKKQDRCKMLIIEKEVQQDDHIIMLAAKWFSEDFQEAYTGKVITEELMTQVQNQIQFITRFQSELIKRIYDCTEKKSDVVYRTIFKDGRIYPIIMDAIHALYQDEILAFGKAIRLKQYVTLVELEASPEIQICGDKGGFKLVIEQLKKICESQCPVKKFELIGQVKQKITESLDQYYQSDPNHKQIQVDADNFLIIIIFSLIKYNYGSFLAHIKFVNMVMGKQIEIERDDQSWVYVSFLAAINHINLYQYYDKFMRQSLTIHLKDALTSQKFN